MLNSVTMMGRLVRDPSLKETQTGTKVCSFTIAVDRDFQQGEEKQTDFVNCVAWRQTGEFVSAHFHKGNLICVKGSLQSRKWQDKEGKNRTEWEVIVERAYFSGERNSAQEAPEAAPREPDAPTWTEDTGDGELPF